MNIKQLQQHFPNSTILTKTKALVVAKKALRFGRFRIDDHNVRQKCPNCNEMITSNTVYGQGSAEIQLRRTMIDHMTNGDCGDEG